MKVSDLEWQKYLVTSMDTDNIYQCINTLRQVLLNLTDHLIEKETQ